MIENVRNQIFELIDTDYQKFSAALIPNINNILGVRLPELRKIAKSISKDDWRNYIKLAENEYFEEVMLQGMVIGYAKADIEELLTYVSSFVPKIDNWSTCDSFCSGLKFTKNNKNLMWEFLKPFFCSKEEYKIRFGVVMLLNYYIEDNYIDNVLKILNSIKHEGFYAKMAVAWAISICYVKYPSITLEYLKNNSLDDFTYNKALQKITESNRVDKETKSFIRSMKR
ncbi:DNA alkylation repair protein [Lysinibacillus agricola]|uniref:DNA alkylation repair protein n=1 Tax=Lysinibacillus agricola TaxID=2590012 RepID=A0ABX7ALL6_9BACI|nr:MULTISPECIES: DNA alkylation repair protein [Lysinibacillus]KOS59880.1 DNA alkylation repair protein [Lysinibacillus sp. FJAT-14222]QQP10660.1 DNA alkylation repair protein [Lysinibacillus agricola]